MEGLSTMWSSLQDAQSGQDLLLNRLSRGRASGCRTARPVTPCVPMRKGYNADLGDSRKVLPGQHSTVPMSQGIPSERFWREGALRTDTDGQNETNARWQGQFAVDARTLDAEIRTNWSESQAETATRTAGRGTLESLAVQYFAPRARQCDKECSADAHDHRCGE